MRFESWGEIPYLQASQRQLDLVQARILDRVEDTLVFCTHPRVVTLGRGAKAEDILTWQGEVCESSRGGKATYHGPSQVVVYPIIKLKHRDVLKYLKDLEEVTIQALGCLGLACTPSRQSGLDIKDKKLIPTGVWVNGKKIASIGVAIKKWVAYHGVAVNIDKDFGAFVGIQPCGFSSDVMTSLEEELGKKIPHSEFIEAFQISASRL